MAKKQSDIRQFQCDYTGGCLPEILEMMMKTNQEVQAGYCEDDYCQKAEHLILEAADVPQGRVFWVTSGTMANLVTLSSMLPSYGAVVCADTGHIQTAEAAAIEATGHRVVALPSKEGKLDAEQLEKRIEAFYGANEVDRSHMVKPASVYVTFPTELGSVYSKEELEKISAICQKWKIPLYLDGARLAYGLAASDVTLSDIARLTDAFYIGGTKCGALAGEAIVVKDKKLQADFLGNIRMRGALIAKGRLVGCAFYALFADGLYFRLGRLAVEKAMQIRQAFEAVGLSMASKSPTNQQFVSLTQDQADRLAKTCRYKIMKRNPDGTLLLRFCTSWSTTEEDMDVLLAAIGDLARTK